MSTGILIGIGAGLTATLSFLSAAGGSLLVALVLSLLTPLPVLLAGLGWGYRSAIVASVVAALSILLIAGPIPSLLFLTVFGIALPVLSRLAMLNRVAAATAPGDAQHEWYPPGRLLAVAAAFIATLAVGGFVLLGPEPASYSAALKATIEQLFDTTLAGLGVKKPSPQEIEALTQLYSRLLPVAWGTNWMIVIAGNLWLAGTILRSSGRLARPWPMLSAMTFPALMPLALAASLLLVSFEHPIGTLAAGASGALLAAFTMIGFAILHWLTRGIPARPLLLTGAYLLAILFMPLGTIVIALLGITDPILRLRQRARPGPPVNHPPRI